MQLQIKTMGLYQVYWKRIKEETEACDMVERLLPTKRKSDSKIKCPNKFENESNEYLIIYLKKHSIIQMFILFFSIANLLILILTQT